MTGGLPAARTREGQEGLAEIIRQPRRALIATDFDGTLAPIVTDPAAVRSHPAAMAALRRLTALVGTVAVITGRSAAEAVALGGFADVPGLIVFGAYGWERWQDGTVTSPPAPPGVGAARSALSAVLVQAAAPDGVRVEDKGRSLAVHTRGTADPAGTLERLAAPLARLADATGLAYEPGRLVIELRPPGMNKGAALTALAAERGAGPLLFAGDDLGDVAAFAAVRALRARGHPGISVYSASAEVSELADQADLVVDGPEGISCLLSSLADAIAATC